MKFCGENSVRSFKRFNDNFISKDHSLKSVN